MVTRRIDALPARIDGGEVVIQAGRVSDVKEDSVYTIMPADSAEANEHREFGRGDSHHDPGLYESSWLRRRTGSFGP